MKQVFAIFLSVLIVTITGCDFSTNMGAGNPNTTLVQEPLTYKTEIFNEFAFDVPENWAQEKINDSEVKYISESGDYFDVSRIESDGGGGVKETLEIVKEWLKNSFSDFKILNEEYKYNEQATKAYYTFYATYKEADIQKLTVVNTFAHGHYIYIFKFVQINGSRFRYETAQSRFDNTFNRKENVATNETINLNSLYLADFVRWDMNILEVIDKEKRESDKTIVNGSSKFLKIKKYASDYFTGYYDYVYFFIDDSLKSYFVKYTGGGIGKYSEIKKCITNKYGNPAEDIMNWSDPTYKDDESKFADAFAYGYVSMTTKWVVGDTVIIMHWDKDNASIAYCHKSFEGSIGDYVS